MILNPDTRLDHIETRLDAVEKSLGRIEVRLDEMSKRVVTHKDLSLGLLAVAGFNLAVVAAFGTATLFVVSQLAAQIAALR